jgi:hypothetical protein
MRNGKEALKLLSLMEKEDEQQQEEGGFHLQI